MTTLGKKSPSNFSNKKFSVRMRWISFGLFGKTASQESWDQQPNVATGTKRKEDDQRVTTRHVF